MSVRAKARTADVSKNTVSKLLVDAGKVCADYQNKIDQKLTKRKFQTDPLPIYIVGLGPFQTVVRLSQFVQLNLKTSTAARGDTVPGR